MHTRVCFFEEEEQKDTETVSHLLPVTHTSVCKTHEVRQRRFDSLSRLLSLRSKYSACVAVCIFENKIIIASNCSEERQRDFVARFIASKLSVLREMILKYEHATLPSTVAEAQHYFDDEIRALKKYGGCFYAEPVIAQACYKIMKSIQGLDEGHVLKPEEIQTLRTSEDITILVPGEFDKEDTFSKILDFSDESLSASEAVFIENIMTYVMYVYDKDAQVSGYYDFPPSFNRPSINALISVNSFHAEQLLAYYMQEVQHLVLDHASEDPLTLGISKLSCVSCASLFKFRRLQLRGQSHERFNGVAVIFEDRVEQKSLPLAEEVLEAGEPSSIMTPLSKKIKKLAASPFT